MQSEPKSAHSTALNSDLLATISPYLEPGEELTWVGRRHLGYYLRRLDIFLLALGTFMFSIFSFLVLGDSQDSGNRDSNTYGLLLLLFLFDLLIPVAIWLNDVGTRRRDLFSVTSKALLCLRTTSPPRFRRYPLDQIERICRKTTPTTRVGHVMLTFAYAYDTDNVPMRLAYIDDAEGCYQAILSKITKRENSS